MIVNSRRITADTAVLEGPGSFQGVFVEASTGGSVIVYDNASAASGRIIFSKSLTTGEVVTFGGLGVRVANGIYADVSGTLTLHVLYKG